MWRQRITAAYQSIYGQVSLADWLQETVWQKVELHKKSKLCCVVYQRETAFTAEELQKLEPVFQKLLPPGLQVELIQSGATSAAAAENEEIKEERTEKDKDVLLKDGLVSLYGKKPKAKLWLLSCDYTWTGTNQLTISFPSQVAKDTCKKLGVDDFLADYLNQELGCICSVSLQFEQELQQSIMAAAEKREEKIIASALTAQKVAWGYSGPIYGKFIYDSPIAISAVFDRDDFCVVRGEILAVTESSLKSGKTVYLLTIYDDTGYLPLKISAAKDKNFYPEYLTPGQWIKCRGKYGMDRFSGEVLFSVFDVEGISHPVWGSDLADEKRVELALHTKASSFCSIIPVAQGVYTAAKWGQHGIGVADLHSVAAFPKLAAACKEYGIKAIYGLEIAVWDMEKSIGRIIVWARNRQGIATLYELLSMVFRHRVGKEEGLDYADVSPILRDAERKSHVFCGLWDEDFTTEDWCSYWQGLVDCLLIGPAETKECQQRQKNILQQVLEQGVTVIATDKGACYSDRQYEIVRFLRENGGKNREQTVCKITSTDGLLRAFYYLGEDMAKKLVVESSEQLYQKIESLSPIAGQALGYAGYAGNDDFWQKVLKASQEKYAGVIPQEVLLQLEIERPFLLEKGYDWLYPALLQLKEKYNGLFLLDNLLTSYVLGLSRENPLLHFIHCYDCGFSGASMGFLCPNCGHAVQEFGMGTITEKMDGSILQKICICGLPENKEMFWQDLSALIKDCLLVAPGVYRQLSWESTEAMAEIFLSGEEREEFPGERQWFAATCQGMLLGVERDESTRLLIPDRENIYQFTPLLGAERALYTYFPEEVLSPFVLSFHYLVAEEQQLFWELYRLLPAHRQAACMQSRDWGESAVWTMLKNHYWQGIPYLEQYDDSGVIDSVEHFICAVAHSIGIAVADDQVDADASVLQDEMEDAADSSASAGGGSVEGLLAQFGREIGFTWDICTMKAYSPEVFYVVALNRLADRSNFRDMWQEKTVPGGSLGQLIKEMKAQEIQVLPIDINTSQTQKFILTKQGILASLDSTAAFDRELIEQIDFHRSQEMFSSQRDFFHRLNISPHLQHLFLTEHLLDGLPEDSQTSLF